MMALMGLQRSNVYDIEMRAKTTLEFAKLCNRQYVTCGRKRRILAKHGGYTDIELSTE